MAALIDIYNHALSLVGATRLTSVSDATENRRLCDDLWPSVRDSELRKHTWNFSVSRVQLPALTDSPSWGWSYQHQLPGDCLRVLDLQNLRHDEYQVEGRVVLSDSTPLKLRYVARVTDTTTYDATFVELGATKLAHDMCERVNQSNTKKAALYDAYVLLRSRAAAVDGVENPPFDFDEDDWVRARQ